MIKHFLVGVVLTALLGNSSFAALAEREKKLTSYIDSQNRGALSLLEKVVNINSDTKNTQGVRNVGRVFDAEFKRLGMKTKWISMPKSMKRAGHLFAWTPGKKGKRLLLIGHLDTVFKKDGPFQKYAVKGKYAYGPGVNDMKGGLVVIVEALKALKSIGVLDQMNITVAFMGDEESAGKPLRRARKDLIRVAKKSDYAIGFEYGVDSINKATVARRSYTGWKLEVKGKRGHSSRIFSDEYGAGATYALASILSQFYKEFHNEKYLTINPGISYGGTEAKPAEDGNSAEIFGKGNVVAQTAYASGDLRTLTPEQRDRTKKRMKEIVSRTLPLTRATIKFDDAYPPMAPTRGNQELLAAVSLVSDDLGFGKVTALDPGKRGAADTSFVAPHVSAIDGLGLLGDGAHSLKERVELAAIPKITKRTAVLLLRLSGI